MYLTANLCADEKPASDQKLESSLTSLANWWDLTGKPVCCGTMNVVAGRYDAAVVDFTAALRTHSNSALLYQFRGWAYGQQENYDRAIADFTEVIRLDPKNAEAFWERARNLVSKQEFDRAITDCDRALQIDPDQAWVFITRAAAYGFEGNLDRALEDCCKAIEIDPKWAIACSSRGAWYLEKGDYDRALADFDQAIRLDCNDSMGYVNRGAAYCHKEDYDRAIADFSRAIELDAKDSNAIFDRGMVFLQKQQYDRAIADFTEAIRLDPKEYGLYFGRATALIGKQQSDRALADCNQAVRLQPNSIAALFLRSQLHFDRGDRESAIADLSVALQIKGEDHKLDVQPHYRGGIALFALPPPKSELELLRGRAYGTLGDWDKAIADFSEVLRLDPKNVDARRYRAEVLLYKGDNAKASQDLTEVLRINPKFTNVYLSRALAYAAAQKFDKAILDCDQAIKLQPNLSLAFALRASVRGALLEDDEKKSSPKEMPLALADAGEAIRLDSQNCLAYGVRGGLFYDQKEYQKGVADFSACLRLLIDQPVASSRSPAQITLFNAMMYGGIIVDKRGILLSRGNCYSELEDYDKAIADFTEAIRLAPQDPYAHCLRAWANDQKGEYSKAAAGYAKAIQLDPKYADGYQYFARFLACCPEDARRDGAKAVEYASKACELTEWKDAECLGTLAAAYAEVKDYGKAQARYAEAIRLDPEYLEGYQWLAWFLATCPEDGCRDGAKAVDCALKACELEGWKTPASLDTLAAAYAEHGQFDLAIGWQKKVIELASEDDLEEYNSRLELYEAGKPFQDARPKAKTKD
jgi:tetratricopeptide (TPR) repeat protein